jgi:serine/threonine-protein kinase
MVHSTTPMAERPVVQPPLDRYVVLDYLAEGGMGAIYLGKKLGAGGFEKEVVLKQLLPEFTQQPEFIDLFLREARLSAALDHANIVHTIDLVNAGDEYFMVMEYVRGGDLRTLLKRAKRRKRRLAPAAAIFIAREVLSALAYAHVKQATDGKALGLIHRDVSPSNILVSGTGEVKLTDFGIAKASTHRSIFYRVKGKVGYMSPEQARNENLDSRSDLYSLAVCLYEMLTGERLFVSAGLTTSAEDMYKQPIPQVSRKRPGLAKDLDKVMARALAIKREERYQTAGEFQEALLRVAHKNGLMCTATELSDLLIDACGPVKEWPTATVKDVPRERERSSEGTEAYSFGGDGGTGTAQLGLDALVEGATDGRTGTALLPSGAELDDDEGASMGPAQRSTLDLASGDLEELDSDISDVDGAWARDAQPGRRPTTGLDIGKLQGLELTSIIQMDDLTHAGAKPLVELGTGPSAVRLATPTGGQPPVSTPPAGTPAPPRSPSRPDDPRGSTGKLPTGQLRASPNQSIPTARIGPVAREADPWARRIPTWLPFVGLAVLGIVIAYTIAVSGPDLKPTPPRPEPSPTEQPPPTPAGARRKLTITSEPPGAHVDVDGHDRCTTPCTVDDLPTDTPAVLRLTKVGYLPWTGLATPGAASRRARLRTPPDPARAATVILHGDVPAEVLVNGQEIGHVTTAGPLTLAAGKLQLTLVSANGQKIALDVTLQPGQTLEREVRWK